MGEWYELGLTVEMAFGYAPTATPTWTDVTAYVREIPSIRRGRQSEFSQYAPGTCQLVLDNRARRFDPEYGSSPYAGNLVPMVPVRITTLTRDPLTDGDGIVLYTEDNEWLFVDGDEYPVFYGFVQGWPQAIGKGYTDSTVTVTGVDAFRILGQRPLPDNAYQDEVAADTPIAYYPFTSGSYVDEVAGNDLNLILSSHAWQANDVDWTPAAGVEATAEGGGLLAQLRAEEFLSSAPLAIEFVFVLDPSDPNYDTGSWNIVARAGSSTANQLTAFVRPERIFYRASNVAKNLKDLGGFNAHYIFQAGVVYHVVASWDSDNYVRTYINGEFISETLLTNVGTSTTGFQPQVEAHTGQTVAHFAIYDAPMSAARAAAHYQAGFSAWGGEYVERTGTRIGRVLDDIGWPSGLRDLSTGDSELGPYTPNSSQALSYLRELEQVEQGTIFVARDGDITFRDRSWHIGRTSAVTFADDYSTGLAFRDIYPDANTVQNIINTATVTWAGGTITDMDQASVDAYEAGSVSVSSETIKELTNAQDLARWLIRLGKDPRTRVTRLTVLPRADYANLFPAILGLELGDVLTVKITPLGVGTASEYLLAVQGIQHRVTRREWVTDLYLAPAVASSGPYFKVGDPTLGRVGAVYENRIHY